MTQYSCPESGISTPYNANITMGTGYQILLDDGSAAAPGLAFFGNTDMGIYRDGEKLKLGISSSYGVHLWKNGFVNAFQSIVNGIGISGYVTTSTTVPSVTLCNITSYSASSGMQTHAHMCQTLNQSGTAGYRTLHIDVTETATGSGDGLPLAVDVGGSNIFSIASDGIVSMGTYTADGGATKSYAGYIEIKDKDGNQRFVACYA